MTEEFKMFGTFVPMSAYRSISRSAFHLRDCERPNKSCTGLSRKRQVNACSVSFSFEEINNFAWWAKIVAVGSDHRIVYCPEKIRPTDRHLTRKLHN